MPYIDLIFFVLFVASIFISVNKKSAVLNFLILSACLILQVVGMKLGYVYHIFVMVLLLGGVFIGSLPSRTTYFIGMVFCLCMAYLYHGTVSLGKESTVGVIFYFSNSIYPYVMSAINIAILWSVDKTGKDYAERPFTNTNPSSSSLDSLLNRTLATIRVARSFLKQRSR